MDKEVQAEFRELLLQRLEELYQEAERTVAGMTDAEETFPDRRTGPLWSLIATSCFASGIVNENSSSKFERRCSG